MAAPVDPATRKRVLKVVFISLLLDLVRPSILALCQRMLHFPALELTALQISFTFILPLFPSLLAYYREQVNICE